MCFSLERDQLLGKGEIVLVCPAYLFAQLILGFMSFPEAPAKVEIRSFRTRYGGRRDGGGLRGEGVVAEVAALHAAELDITVMLQVGVGKPAKKVLEMPLRRKFAPATHHPQNMMSKARSQTIQAINILRE